MNKVEDYASDSDQSDEDFCPEAGGDSDVSEDISDENDDDSEQDSDDNGKSKKLTSGKGRKRSDTKRKRTKGKRNTNNPESGDVDGHTGIRRNTRFADVSQNGGKKGLVEKKELESDEEADKSRTDALWADFLSDVKKVEPTAMKNSTTQNNERQGNKSELSDGNKEKAVPKEDSPACSDKKITITEVLDFAGEEVRVQKTVSADSIKENKSTPVSKPRANLRGPMTGTPIAGVKRPASLSGAAGSGLGSILTQIGKKKKLSVLEKTKLDWTGFKQDEGIEEELQTFNKGKDGYLERQDFLQRTDLRQFEIEKNLRQSRRTQ